MVGVPAAGTATTALLFAAGLVAACAVAVFLHSRLRGLEIASQVVAAAALLSIVALPWVGWRFVEDLRTTTKLDSYERENMGPIQAYLPGYLADGARARIPSAGTWAAAVGASAANPIARGAFPALLLTTLFPRVSAPVDRAGWIVAWGIDPACVAAVTDVHVVHARQGPLPPVVVAKRSG
jgi:hypothetical protein